MGETYGDKNHQKDQRQGKNWKKSQDDGKMEEEVDPEVNENDKLERYNWSQFREETMIPKRYYEVMIAASESVMKLCVQRLLAAK